MNRTTLNDALPILRCPRTKTPLTLEGGKLANSHGESYEVSDGIVDLVDESNRSFTDEMESRYDSVGRLLYDVWVANPLIMSTTWGAAILKTPLRVPNMFELKEGWGLDLPCGTGLYSEPVLRRSPGARFLCVDCSMGMLRSARDRFRKKGVENVLCIRADVANLPFQDDVLHGMFSLAGFHAFEDPEAASKEMIRVLRPGSPCLVTALCYGVRKVSDLVIDRFMLPRKIFSQALTPSDYQSILEQAPIDDLQVSMAGALMIATGKRAAS